MTMLDPGTDHGRPATTRSGMPTRLSHLPSGVDALDAAGATYADAYEAMRAVHAEMRRLDSRQARLDAERADEAAYAQARADGDDAPDARAHQRQREANLVDARARWRGEVAHVDNVARIYRRTFDEHRDEVAAEAVRRLGDARAKVASALDVLLDVLDAFGEADRFASWAAAGPTSPAPGGAQVTVPVGDGQVPLRRIVDAIGGYVDRPRTVEGDDRPTYAVTGHSLPVGTDGPRPRRRGNLRGPDGEAVFVPTDDGRTDDD